MVGIAFLMVSTIPTYSGKTMGKYVPRQWVLPIFVLSVAAFGLLISFPWEMLSLITVVFLLTIPVSVMRYRKLRSQADLAKPRPSRRRRRERRRSPDRLDSAIPGAMLSPGLRP